MARNHYSFASFESMNDDLQDWHSYREQAKQWVIKTFQINQNKKYKKNTSN